MWTTERLTAPVLCSGDVTEDAKPEDSPTVCESILERKPCSSPGNQDSARKHNSCAFLDQVPDPQISASTCKASTSISEDCVLKPSIHGGLDQLCKTHEDGLELTGNQGDNRMHQAFLAVRA